MPSVGTRRGICLSEKPGRFRWASRTRPNTPTCSWTARQRTIECFDDAWRRWLEVEGFPVWRPDDIIASKAAANRARDRESLPRLRSFREYWLRQRRR